MKVPDDGSEATTTLHVSRNAGGASGGSVSPLDGHTFSTIDRWFTSNTELEIALLQIFGPVSPEAERVVFDLKGTAAPVEAELFPIPDRFLGPAQVFLVMIDGAEPSPGAEGRLIAYDADGNVLDRVSVS